MKPYDKVKEFLNKTVKDTQSENVLIPYGVNNADRKRYWNNYNSQLVDRILAIKKES